MTAAGDAVLAVALGEVGVTEDPPGSNAVKYWVPWTGSNYGYGPWCAAFVSWCQSVAGYPPCWVDGPQGFTLVSNGTLHGYQTGGDGATGLEAQRTLDLQPGDTILFSWEPWEFRDGIPTCVGEWDGYPAGDHTGFFAYWIDQGAGRFAACEGNTSASSWDNGGAVLLREDRYTSQVCGWWRQESIAGGASPPEPPKGWLDMLTDAQQIELFDKVNAIFWMLGQQTPTPDVATISSQVREIRRMAESTYWMVGNIDPQPNVATVSSDARIARENTERLLEGG